MTINFPHTQICYIYGLKDPRYNEIKYIGQSVFPNKRFFGHLGVPRKQRKTYKEKWIFKLKKLNLKPSLEILKVCKKEESDKYEVKLISEYKPKTNGTSGGNGNYKIKDKEINLLNKPYQKRSGEQLKKHIERTSKPVIVFKNGIKIGRYNSTREAAKILGVNSSNISGVCKGKYGCKTLKGLTFKFEKEC